MSELKSYLSSLQTDPSAPSVPTAIDAVDISVGSPITDKDLLQKSVDEIVVKISAFDKDDIVVKLKKLFLARLRNEYKIAEAIDVGVDKDKFHIDEAIKLLKDSKDGLSQLGTLLRLFEGESTSSVDSKIRVEHVDITERLSALGGGISLPSRN